jgi:diacylglycerol kinase (ATP)
MDNAVTAAVFVNPCAGGGKPARYAAKVQTRFREKGFAAQFVEPKSVKEFRAAVKAAIAQGFKTLVAMGGDGTLQLLVRETLGSSVTLGVIPLGGGNDFAAALEIRDWKQAVETICAGNCRRVDVVRVKFSEGNEAVYVGGGGIGLDADAMDYASGRFRNWPGKSRYLASVIVALRGYEEGMVQIEFPESSRTKITKQALLVSVLNTPSYGGGLHLALGARIDDGELDLVVLEPLRLLEILALLPRLVLRGELRTTKLTNLRSKQVRLTPESDRWFHGDGELLGHGSCEVKILPGAIQILAPPRTPEKG